MSIRVICPACGKLNRLPDDSNISTVVLCLACGSRIPPQELEAQLPAAAGVPSAEADGGDASARGGNDADHADDANRGDGDADATEVPAHAPAPSHKPARHKPAATVARAAPAPAASASRPARGTPAGKIAAVAAACLLVGGAVGALVMFATKRNDVSEVHDLLEIKSEAESLAAEGKLKESHAKYRQFQQLAVGRSFKDPASWDMIDRAKVDQDRVYTLILDQVQALNPPERAIPRPGTGTVTRADDPWAYPRGGTSAAGGFRGGATEDPANVPDPNASARFLEEPEPSVAPPKSDAASDEAPADATADAPAPATPPPSSQTSVAQADLTPTETPTSPAQQPEAPPVSAAASPQPASPARPARPATTAPAALAGAPTPPPWVPEDVVTDDEIGFALKRGSEYLLAQVKDGAIAPVEGMTRTKYSGRNALVVYALLQVGRANRDKRLDPRGEFMGRMIEVMKEHEMERGGREPMQPVVYARSLRAAALALYNRPQDREVLKADTEWLVRSSVKGAYSYDDTFSDLGLKEGASLLPAWDEDVEDDIGDTDPFDARDYFCHGLHDGRGRELNIMRRPQTKRLKTPPPNMPGGRSRTPTPTGVPQRRSTSGPPYVPPPMRDRTLPPIVRSGNPEVDSVMFPWDNSNSQYGLLGVWAAAEAGVEVPRKYWEAVENHWKTYQLKTGEWGYMAADTTGYLSMTCGGVASLWVTYDWLVAPKSKGQVGRETMSDNLAAGMKWLETADNAVNTPLPGKTHYPGYDLFGLERVGLASGFKYFGSHDWYRVLAAKSLASQLDSGAWWREDAHPDGLIETAYQLLFLSHGRHPIFMNKLRFDNGRGEQINGEPVPGYWANRPRDIANLTRFATRELERPFNWQVVDLRREWHDWLDCPVLYIASHSTPGMGDADYAKLRQFAEAGGLIFTHADAGAASYTRWVIEELVPKTFGPNLKAAPLPENHPIYSVHYDVKRKPQLWGVSNGSRLLLVHSPTDLASAWQQRGDRTHTPMFQLGINLFLYAAGIADFRNRIDSPYVPPAPPGAEGSVGVARVKYDGDWDPEPGAWRRFANLYGWELDTSVPVTPTEFAQLDATKTPIAHLTGTGKVQFSDAQATALRSYVQAGGIVLVDPCGGSPAFNASVRDGLMTKAFPNGVPAPLPRDHILLTGGDPKAEPLDLKLRRYPLEKLKMPTPPLEHVKSGKGSVILSQVDITSGLLGTNGLTIIGYDAPFAQAIVWNLLGWPTPAPPTPATQPAGK